MVLVRPKAVVTGDSVNIWVTGIAVVSDNSDSIIVWVTANRCSFSDSVNGWVISVVTVTV